MFNKIPLPIHSTFGATDSQGQMHNKQNVRAQNTENQTEKPLTVA